MSVTKETKFDGLNCATEFEKYKYFVENDADIKKSKSKVADIAHQNQLTSVMNDTKWIELQFAVSALSFPPAYHVKLLSYPENCPVGTFDKEPCYYGDWSSFWEEGLPLFFDIEWMKVCPRYSKHRGQLIADEILDETEDFIAILRKYNIPFENDNGTIIIYGYR